MRSTGRGGGGRRAATLLAAGLWACFLAALSSYAGPCYPATPTRVIDGDTASFRIHVRHVDVPFGLTVAATLDRRVRLASVRAAEMRGSKGETPEERQAREVLAEAARDMLARLLASGEVEICPLTDRHGRAVESFGRVVADVRVDGASVGDALIAAGVAWPGTAEGHE